MTFEERAAAVVKQGFTERQARFLVTVMLHSGVCMLRHYCAFAGIVCGQKARDFFKDPVNGRFATAYACAHGRARILHVHRRGLYQAVGERDSRLRRPTPIPRAVERLMVLDAVLATADVTWLATERDKLTHFTLLLKSRLDRDDLPHLRFGTGASTTIRYFPDRLPVGMHSDGLTHVFTYLVNREVPVDFRPFLRRHAPLLCGRRDRLKAHYTISESGRDAHISLLTGRPTANRQSLGASKSYAPHHEYIFAPRVFTQLQNAQAIVVPFDGINPLPPQYCYLKPYYLDAQTSYFDHLERGAL